MPLLGLNDAIGRSIIRTLLQIYEHCLSFSVHGLHELCFASKPHIFQYSPSFAVQDHAVTVPQRSPGGHEGASNPPPHTTGDACHDERSGTQTTGNNTHMISAIRKAHRSRPICRLYPVWHTNMLSCSSGIWK